MKKKQFEICSKCNKFSIFENGDCYCCVGILFPMPKEKYCNLDIPPKCIYKVEMDVLMEVDK